MLRARVIFWVTMAISALVALMYLSIGFSETGVTIFGYEAFESDVLNSTSPMAETFYVGLFSKFIAGLWLSWIAIILALISCASIFPDTMNEGSAGVVMTKALGRLGIFVTKYIGSLFFVAIQVGLFCFIVFIALKLRVGSWNPSVFWFVPIIVLVFSYLYSVLVLVAVKTRSVLVAILLCIGFWFTCWLLSLGEGVLYEFKRAAENEPEEVPFSAETMTRWHGFAKGVYAIVPKPGATLELTDRVLVVNGERGFSNSDFVGSMMGVDMADLRPDEGAPDPAGVRRDLEEIDEAAERHSVWYVLGTSLAFEFVILSMAAWSFCRRDF